MHRSNEIKQCHMDGKPEGVFRGRKQHSPRLALNNFMAGVRERQNGNRTRDAGHLDEIQGVGISKHTEPASPWGQPAREWSRGGASDIDGQTEGRIERERMSQFFRSWLHRMVKCHGCLSSGLSKSTTTTLG